MCPSLCLCVRDLNETHQAELKIISNFTVYPVKQPPSSKATTVPTVICVSIC